MSIAHNKKRIFLILSCFCIIAVPFAHKGQHNSKVNTYYAIEYLEESAELFYNNEYREALAYARQGINYDNTFGDLFYLKAASLTKLNGLPADILEAAERACTQGMQWRLCNKNDAEILLGKVYTETCNYQEALTLLKNAEFESADNDFYYAYALYGLGRHKDAQSAIKTALDRWSLDPRFAKLFFLQERNKPMSRSSKQLADMIMQRLDTWLETDPALAVYACPFDPNPKENIRPLKIYRNMYASSPLPADIHTQLSAILAELQFGVIDEETAVNAFFAVRHTGHGQLLQGQLPSAVFFSDQIREFTGMIGTASVRKLLAKKLHEFNGVVVEDVNNDTIINAAVFYEQGRPVSAMFDPNQDGKPDYTAVCNFGTPSIITDEKNSDRVLYDTYPNIRLLTRNEGAKEYRLKPRALRWTPIKQYDYNLQLDLGENDPLSFFTLRLAEYPKVLTEREITVSSVYCDEPDNEHKEYTKRTCFENGNILSVEVRNMEHILSYANYKNGVIRRKTIDYNGDGYFETHEEYSPQGKLEKILIDINKNNRFEYTEYYKADDTIIKTWDNREKGSTSIQYTQRPSGIEETMWKQSKTGKKVMITSLCGIPKTLSIGRKRFPILKEPSANVYWLESRPSLSSEISVELEKIFKSAPRDLNSYLATIKGYTIFAVYSGGVIYVEIHQRPTPKE